MRPTRVAPERGIKRKNSTMNGATPIKYHIRRADGDECFSPGDFASGGAARLSNPGPGPTA